MDTPVLPTLSVLPPLIRAHMHLPALHHPLWRPLLMNAHPAKMFLLFVFW
jgi:hypothetical protein